MYTNEKGDLKIVKVATHAILGLIVFSVILGSFGTIGAGGVGVETRLGAVVATKQPGLYFKLPLIEQVIQMDVQTQKEEVKSVSAASQDLQEVTTDVAINYHLEGSKAATIYQNIGTDYASRVIDPAIQESVKANTAKYTAEQLITQRETVRQGIIDLLTQKLSQFGVQVDAVNITDFKFSADFTKAIETKVTAVQNAEAAKNKLAQVKYEADQTIAKAQGDAEAIRIQAQAINSQGGADYVALQAIKAWDGHLPQYMIPGASTPILDLRKVTN